MGTIHLENRTDGSGRQAQLETVLEAADRLFPGDMPVILGGDLNTNTFDGRDKAAIQAVAGDAALQRRCLEEVADWEGCLPAAQARGYRAVPVDAVPTRRKPLPGGGFLGLRLDWLLIAASPCRGRPWRLLRDRSFQITTPSGRALRLSDSRASSPYIMAAVTRLPSL